MKALFSISFRIFVCTLLALLNAIDASEENFHGQMAGIHIALALLLWFVAGDNIDKALSILSASPVPEKEIS